MYNATFRPGLSNVKRLQTMSKNCYISTVISPKHIVLYELTRIAVGTAEPFNTKTAVIVYSISAVSSV